MKKKFFDKRGRNGHGQKPK